MAKVLPVAEPEIINRLLTQQAEEFFEGARFMEKHKFKSGDSCYFLKLMAIELYFKLVYLKETESLVFGHDVCEIYNLLPMDARKTLFEGFNEHMSMHIEDSTFREWLKYMSGLFVLIRYPFEEFREMSQSQYEDRIRQFVDSPPEDLSKASIIYHNDRITALIGTQRLYLGLHSA